jgi:hypothetical protein
MVGLFSVGHPDPTDSAVSASALKTVDAPGRTGQQVNEAGKVLTEFVASHAIGWKFIGYSQQQAAVEIE